MTLGGARSPDGAVHVTGRYAAACTALALVLHEAHELAHTTTGRLVCGGWGPRDFNSWQLPADCTSTLPTLAGPALSFALIWIGGLLLLRGSARRHPLGVALVLMPNPAGRWLTAAMGGGDEGVLVRAWAGVPRGPVATGLALAIVAGLTLVPLARAWRAIAPDGRPLRFVALLLLPMVATGVLLFVLGNRLLAAGFLARPQVAGAPALVWLATVMALVAVVLLAPGRWRTRIR